MFMKLLFAQKAFILAICLFTSHEKCSVLCDTKEVKSDVFYETQVNVDNKDQQDYKEIKQKINNMNDKDAILLFLKTVTKENLNRIITKENTEKLLKGFKKNIENDSGCLLKQSTLNNIKSYSEYNNDVKKFIDEMINTFRRNKTIENIANKANYIKYLNMYQFYNKEYQQKVITMLINDAKMINDKEDLKNNVVLENKVLEYFANEDLLSYVELRNALSKNTNILNLVCAQACEFKKKISKDKKRYQKKYNNLIESIKAKHEEEINDHTNRFLEKVNTKKFTINGKLRKFSDSKFANAYIEYVKNYITNLKSESNKLILKSIDKIINCDSKELADCQNNLIKNYITLITSEFEKLIYSKNDLEMQIIAYNKTYEMVKKEIEKNEKINLDIHVLLRNFYLVDNAENQQTFKESETDDGSVIGLRKLFETNNAEEIYMTKKIIYIKSSHKQNIISTFEAILQNIVNLDINIPKQQAIQYFVAVIEEILEQNDMKNEFIKSFEIINSEIKDRIVFNIITCGGITKDEEIYKECEKLIKDGHKIYKKYVKMIVDKFVSEIEKKKIILTLNIAALTDIEKNLKDHIIQKETRGSNIDDIARLAFLLDNIPKPKENYEQTQKKTYQKLLSYLDKTKDIFNILQNKKEFVIDKAYIQNIFEEFNNNKIRYKEYEKTMTNKIVQELQERIENQVVLKDAFITKILKNNEIDETLGTNVKSLMLQILILSILGGENAFATTRIIKSMIDIPNKIAELKYEELRKFGNYNNENEVKKVPDVEKEAKNNEKNDRTNKTVAITEENNNTSNTKKYLIIVGTIIGICCVVGGTFFIIKKCL